MSKILVIGAGWEQYALIEQVKLQGHYVIATHPNVHAEAFALADKFFVRESLDLSSHLSVALTHGISAVISDNCDYSLLTASIVASKLSLPFASVESALFSNDKFRQRCVCSDAGIKQPKFEEVRTPNDTLSAAERIGYPIVLKPVDSRGTFGVTIVDNPEELHIAYYEAISNSPGLRLICEKFIEGELVTVDGFCFSNGHQSLTVASRKYAEGKKPVTKYISYPSDHSAEMKQKLLENHHNVINALNYNFGHTHGEYIVTPSGEIYLVECANRGGGVYTSSTINPLLTGIDLNGVFINQCLGEDSFKISSGTNNFMTRAVALAFLDLEVGRVLKKINHDEICGLPFVYQFRSAFSEKQMIESVENCASRHLMVVVDGANQTDLSRNYDLFKSTLKVEYY
jgi:biotin carboxylase